MKHLTLAELLVRQQRRNRIAQRAVGMMACAWLLLLATMISGWVLTW